MPSPRVDAEILVAHVLGVSRSEVYSADDQLGEEELRRLDSAQERRRLREPLAYILGEWGFRRLTLKVDRASARPAAGDGGARRALPGASPRSFRTSRPGRGRGLRGDRAGDRGRASGRSDPGRRPLRGRARSRAREPCPRPRRRPHRASARATCSRASPGRSTSWSRTRRTSPPRISRRSSPRSASSSLARRSSGWGSEPRSPGRPAPYLRPAAGCCSSAVTGRRQTSPPSSGALATATSSGHATSPDRERVVEGRWA